MNVKAMFRQVPTMAYLVVGLVAAGASWLALNNAHQREVGALAGKLKATQDASDSTAKALRKTITSLDGKVAEFRGRLAQYAVRQVRTDTATARLRTARDSLAQTVADSLATIQQLRDRATRLIAASDSAEDAHRRERLSADSALASAKRATSFAVDSVKKASLGALNAAIQRAVTAERLLHVKTGWRARVLARCGATGGYGWVQAGSGIRAGPALILGCRGVP